MERHHSGQTASRTHPFAAFLLALILLAPPALPPARASQTTPPPAPTAPNVQPPAVLIEAEARQVSAGGDHTCALTMHDGGGATAGGGATTGGVKCWGNNRSGLLGTGGDDIQATPADVRGLESGVSAVAAGGSHTCALTVAGGVKCWGANVDGQLGDGSGANQTAPVDVKGLESGVVAVAAGGYHTCALSAVGGGATGGDGASGGGVKCWGSNGGGQLGDGTSLYRSLTPVDVLGLQSGVVALAAGARHTCALTAAGAVKCWGEARTGADQWTPVDVRGLESGVVSLAAGEYHTCAAMADGQLKCWGSNYYGQLGDSTTTSRYTPTNVLGLAGAVTAVAAGANHTCAVIEGGRVQCWGRNQYGEVGDGTWEQRTTPVEVGGLDGWVEEITAGSEHTCARVSGGGLRCWGHNFFGQLGNDLSSYHITVPVDAGGLPSGVVGMAAGGEHTCALTSPGSGATRGGVKCWGDNEWGQVGDGSTVNQPWPVDVSGLGRDVAAVAAGEHHTCALTNGGGLKCWGSSYYGNLGDGSTGNYSTTPVDVVGLGSGVVAVAAGAVQTCAVTATGGGAAASGGAAGGGVKCWGAGGLLGNGTTTDSGTPVDVTGLESGVLAVTTGSFHTCALVSAATDGSAGGGAPTGGVKCWGANEYGALGDGTRTYRSTPVDVVGLDKGVVAVAAGGYHTCALTSDGGVKCWGNNGTGAVGDGSSGNDRTTPVDVYGLGSGVTAITAGYDHTCALTTAGGVKCWGSNSDGQLGDGTLAYRIRPEDVTGLTSGVVAIDAGWFHTCALTSGGGRATTGGVKCWGRNVYGQLGTDPGWRPVKVVGFAQGDAERSGTATTLAAAPNPVKLGEPVTFKVVVTSGAGAPEGAPAGEVELSVDGVLLATLTLERGSATFTTATLAAGEHLVLARYLGQDQFAPSESRPVELTIEQPVARQERTYLPFVGSDDRSRD